MSAISHMLLCLIVCMIAHCAHAQYDHVWAFGSFAGLDFNNGAPVPITTEIRTREGSASVCDAGGNLLFYTDGSYIWNRRHDLMPGSATPIIPMDPNASISPTFSTAQGALIVPVPEHPDLYYVFSLTATELISGAGMLYYSIVDMRLDNGFGDVVASSRGIPLDSGLTEHMTAVAGNACNVWLLVISRSDSLKAYHIDSGGISRPPVLSPLLKNDPHPSAEVGSMDVSPDRRKLAVARGLPGLYDFDPETGTVTNGLFLAPNPNYFSACFSPGNTKLYVGKTDNVNGSMGVYQYDLISSNPVDIINSATRLGSPVYGYYGMKRGPDAKIYISDATSPVLHVIQFPENQGLACQYTQGGLTLVSGTMAQLGMPNINVSPVERVHYQRSFPVFAGCFTDRHVLEADTSGKQHIWDNGSGGTTREIRERGAYWVRYQAGDACIFYTDTFIVDFQTTVLPFTGVSAACRNDTNGTTWVAPVPGDTNTYYYTWSDMAGRPVSYSDTATGLAAGSYAVRVISASGCDTILEVLVPEEHYEVSFTGDTLVCAGDEIRFANTSDLHFDTFTWMIGDGAVSSDRDAVHRYSQGGSYGISLIGKGQVCTDTVSRTIIVDDTLAVTIMKDDDSLCAGEAVTLTGHGTDNTMVASGWQLGDGTQTSGALSIQHTYQQSGIMPVQLTVTFRVCPDVTVRDTLYVFPVPEVDLGPDTSICPGSSPIVLHNRIAQSVDYRYVWNTRAVSPQISAGSPGVYHVTVTSGDDCVAFDEIEIRKDCYLDIPNVFTPDGDGRNDYFFPGSSFSGSVVSFRIVILNRWGQKVYGSTALNGRGWDGTLNNQPQPPGVYVYQIEVSFANGVQERYQGNVTLVR